MTRTFPKSRVGEAEYGTFSSTKSVQRGCSLLDSGSPWVPSPGGHKLDMVMHACNPSTREREAGES